MSNYSYVSILKRRAKSLSRDTSISLAVAQGHVSLAAGFAHFHELNVIAKRKPDDPRLMKAALGIVILSDAIYEDDVYSAFESEIDDLLSDAVGETNATGFTVKGLSITDSTYDIEVGVLTLRVSFAYEGEQDQDRMYHGSAFYLDAQVRLVRRDDEWRIAEEGVEILAGESDKDRDREMGLDDQYAQWLDEQNGSDGLGQI
ncbi:MULTISPECIES: hypothetical protein [unclassified Pseudomonas]|uniref:hypothetical protein n=1 Tax=unclassified Pseudomonas TaxID=196821 RepID=UPI0030D75D39